MYPAEKMSALSVFKFFYSIFEWGTLAEIADTDYRGFFSKHRFLSFSVLFTFPFPFVPVMMINVVLYVRE